MVAKDILQALRPKQWTKNVLVFAGVVFAEDIFNPNYVLLAISAFGLFCMISSAGYLINDVIDLEKDRLHPKKRNRPIASGRLNVSVAIGMAAFLFLSGFIISARLDRSFFMILAIYFLMTLSYSLGLKRVMIVDVLVIASGFMLRAIGGTVIIHEPISSWLIICTSFLALFLAINKRKAELQVMGKDSNKTRSTLEKYSHGLLDQMIMTMTSACLISYALYTLDESTVAKFDSRNLVFTLPFVIYGLFRYLYLVQHTELGETPEIALYKDKPLFLCILLYALTVAAIIYIP